MNPQATLLNDSENTVLIANGYFASKMMLTNIIDYIYFQKLSHLLFSCIQRTKINNFFATLRARTP